MLKQVLKELATGNACSLTNLAQRLEVSEGLLEQMVDDLVRRGYLAPLAVAEGGGCDECAGCAPAKSDLRCLWSGSNVTKGWTLTRKGIEAAKR